ncbi:energy transducer TonB [Mucilaginibacter sp. HMF5004]|uniref:energy transducer TonB n=1 Tax=Mucilaginibacter rivuli TaxID=2857527 RepID=UPI001C5FC318|nr:energy transducer TonB [Mucilaginibacter rivuli]MBW4889611.1 energy transducer TonB [Mucilaginibacter rivuli]
MTRYFPLLLLFLFSSALKAQTINVIKTGPPPAIKAIDVEPEFPGGTKAFYKYISKSITFPADVDPEQVQGIITLSMAIEKDGSLTDIKILKGLTETMDVETLRIMKASPRWKPGMQHGNPIRVRYTFNINYSLVGKKK